MADTINTNSFFNQPEGEGGGISSVQVLAQNAFDIATNVRAQFNSFVQTFDKYKLDADENDRLISNTVSDLDIQTDETDRTIKKTIKDFNDKFKAIEDDIGGQDDKIKGLEITVDKITETVKQIQQSQKDAAEKVADDAFRAQDAAQKGLGGKTAAGLGGLASMMGASAKPDGGDPEDPEDPKEKGLLERLKDNVWGLGMGAAGLTSALWSGAGDKLGGIADFFTGGLTDFDKKGRGRFDAFDPISGGKDKKWGAESKIDIDSDLNEFPVKEEKGGFLSNFFGKKKDKEKGVEAEVDSLESRVDALESGDPPPKDDGSYTVKDSDFSQEDKKRMSEISEEMDDLEEEGKVFSPEYEKLEAEEDAIIEKYSNKGKIESKEGTDEKGLEPKGEEGEKKEKGLFGGFFGGLFGKKKEKKEEKPVSTSERTVTRREVKPHHFDMKTGKAYIDGEEVPIELYQEFQSMSSREKLNDPRFSTGDPISPDSGLKPTSEKKEKGEGGGFKRAAGGFADFMTGGMFDFDKKNRKGAPKDFGIRRMAGGVTDAMTMGLTDFDKRGSDNLQFGPIGGGKDKAWGSANEQAKRGEKQSGMGIKRGIGGALDFATLGTFDFDKQNKKDAPKGWGIKRVAGGLADAITAGATDFDKRGTGIGQMKLGENMRRKKQKQKSIEARENSSFFKNNQSKIDSLRDKSSQIPMETTVNPDGSITSKGSGRLIGGELFTPGQPLTQKQYGAVKFSIQMGNKPAEDVLRSYKMYEEQGGGESVSSKGTDTNISSVPSGSGANFNQLSQPLESESDGMPEVLPIQTVAGDNTASNYVNKIMSDKGAFKNDLETAEGTYCPIGCINMMKANSTRQILV